MTVSFLFQEENNYSLSTKDINKPKGGGIISVDAKNEFCKIHQLGNKKVVKFITKF